MLLREPFRPPAQVRVGTCPPQGSHTWPRLPKAGAARPSGVSSGPGCGALEEGRALGTTLPPPSQSGLFCSPLVCPVWGPWLSEQAWRADWEMRFFWKPLSAGQPSAGTGKPGWRLEGSFWTPGL